MDYIVYEERYFCRPIGEWRDKRFFSAVVMRADIENGGDPLLIDRVILVDSSRSRESNKKDCETFKIEISNET